MKRYGCLFYLIGLVVFWIGLIIGIVSVFAFMRAVPAQAATEEIFETEESVTVVIQTDYSQRNAIHVDSPPPIQEEESAPAAPQITAEAVIISETPGAPEKPAEPDGFIYLEAVPMDREKQARLYELWTGAGYEYATALAMIDKETGGQFNENAVNHDTHDYGLFQLNRKSWQGTFRKIFGISTMDDMMDFELNIRGAIYVYGDCVDRYGQTERAIVAYNMGFAYYDSTKYSRDVMAKREKWLKLLEEAGG